MSTILDKIVSEKIREIKRDRAERPLAHLERDCRSAPPPRDFVGALRARHPMGLIAEVKRASPSAGRIRDDFDPVAIARAYESAGAACISVLTDEPFFEGHLSYLRAVRREVSIPVLRKDFILDPYQVWQSRAAGADAVLLIAECLGTDELPALYHLVVDLGMTPLVELFDPHHLPRVLALDPPLIGVNNRDLTAFVTRLSHVIELRREIPESILVVGESGIKTHEDVLLLQESGVHAILVGETLMRCPDVALGIQQLLRASADSSGGAQAAAGAAP